METMNRVDRPPTWLVVLVTELVVLALLGLLAWWPFNREGGFEE